LSSSLADTPSSPDKLLLWAVTSAFCLGSIAMYWGHFNWLHCHGLIAISIGFNAMGSLSFQLASMSLVLCRFNWLHCHGLIAVSISFNATGSLPFDWLHCHRLIAISIGFHATGSLPFNWFHCHGLIAVLIGFIAMGSLPFQMASLPRVHCHFDLLHCHEFIAIPLASLPFLGYIAFPIGILLQIRCAHACL
jgi:hypothetical protein